MWDWVCDEQTVRGIDHRPLHCTLLAGPVCDRVSVESVERGKINTALCWSERLARVLIGSVGFIGVDVRTISWL